MDSVIKEKVRTMASRNYQEQRAKLADLFSGYRAEWINEEIFNLFTEPSYFPQLTTSHPCILVGGRGTGKTTALRCLSYQGQAMLRQSNSMEGNIWSYFGIYHRINTNRVRAFDGPELSETLWIKVFAHYINIEFCELLCSFLLWYTERYPSEDIIKGDVLNSVSSSLHMIKSDTLEDFQKQLRLAKLVFEAGINNVADSSEMPNLSMQGAPIDTFLRGIRDLPQFCDKAFFFLIDEYENLNSYQQRVMNTLVKHCGELYSFKIGVRELGFRERSTLNPMEQLSHPADYKRIDITEELSDKFSSFAAEVCDRRLNRSLGQELVIPDIQTMLPELTAEEEVIKLGLRPIVNSLLGSQLNFEEVNEERRDWFQHIDLLEQYVLLLRTKIEGKTLEEKLLEVMHSPAKWREQYGNYKHSYLFSIKKGKAGIRKYFAGWRVYCLLAGSNIRYLLELVDQAFNIHLDNGHDPLEEPVTSDVQTKAAQETGQKNLRELEGLSLQGARLTRLLLGLGRIFQVMAEQPIGHTPEVNQFHLRADVEDKDRRGMVDELLTEGVMHLALARYQGSKLQQASDIRQFDYAIHPIFSPFFSFSHRRKRKIELDDRDIRNLIDKPTETIREIVSRQNREMEEALPEQMTLFKDYYDAVSE